MRGEWFCFQQMLETRKRGGPTFLAENGHSDSGESRRGVDEEKIGILLDLDGERAHQICSFIWADIFFDHVALREDLEQTSRDLFEETNRWDLEPKPASLWRTSAYDSEEKIDMNLGTESGCCTFPFEDTFKILGCAMSRQGKAHDAIEERMQSTIKAFWKDILIYKSKGVPWTVKCQRLVDHVYPVFTFGSENWSMEHTDVGEDHRMGI